MKKHTYLENTKNNHSKFYEMTENDDSASFTASWGRIGTTGRTQIYGMNEWPKIYISKLNKGYRDTTTKKIHYDVGQVDVEVNHSHQNKLRILKMTMENWAHDDGKNFALDSAQGRLYEADLDRVTTLLDVFTKIDDDKHLLTKEEMYEMNVIFKTYDGKRVPNV
jgi:predicted DNA-binding WGR domain protein